MAIIDRFASARGWSAQFSIRQDTIDPTPEDGTHWRSSEEQDEHVPNSGASSLAQHPQRRIIKIGAVRSPGLLPTSGVRCASNRSMRASM
ncbi:hypothetical protein [Nocardia sp. R7R-8]|uniref:hypothetical protein n=1 Tax=Nocardia sp. R7R-8 TaxID=3459304 RepID=UPI00403D70DD